MHGARRTPRGGKERRRERSLPTKAPAALMNDPLLRMDLTGHHSNPPRSLKALLEGRSDGRLEHPGPKDRPDRGAAEQTVSPVGSRHRRHDWVLEAVLRVLAERKEPMRARDVHGAVEALLGAPVRWGSVKKCLSSNVTGVSPRFVRVARGRYVASPATTDSDATGPGPELA
jgi:hypothetical protein